MFSGVKLIVSGKLENEKIVLKSLSPEVYANKVVEWLSNPNTNTYLFSRYREITCREQIKYIQSMNDSNDSYYFGVFNKETLEFIGTTTCRIKDQVYLEIGILIGSKRFQGKGYGSNCLSVIEEFAKSLKLNFLCAGMEVDNHHSINLFKRAGFLIGETAEINDFGTLCFYAVKSLGNDNMSSQLI